MPQNPQQEMQKPSKGDILGVLLLIANAHATCFTVFFRSNFGVEALGFPGLTAFLMMVVYGTLRAPEMFIYLGAWFIALLAQRMRTLRMVRQGCRVHSRYTGYPALAMKLPGVTERTAVVLVEPLLCLLVGAFLYCTVSQALGGFVMFGVASLLFRYGIEQQITRKRVQTMRDAEIEQRYLAERFRGGDEF
jgi:hypothetical protein